MIISIMHHVHVDKVICNVFCMKSGENDVLIQFKSNDDFF